VARKDYLATVSRRWKRSNRTAKADAYACGWVIGCRNAALDLLPVKEVSRMVDTYIASHYPKLRESNIRRTSSLESKSDRFVNDALVGLQDGKKVRLSAGVDGSDYPRGQALTEAPKQLNIGFHE
jgi:hypothetical protein